MSSTSTEARYLRESGNVAVKPTSIAEHTEVEIPKNVKLKMLAQRIEKPAVDIEFHDLVHRVDTVMGKSDYINFNVSNFLLVLC